ncbi:MAG TPA: flagellin [Caulobacteraceae bacterium]|jgi:flagellar hook-associated protein 3 FlgL|nr:flagellin [Caulobacteraceae bacterium]
MERVSTSGVYQSALLNILSAESRQNDAQTQVSTGKVASDLKGFGIQADTLAATRSLSSRIDSYVENAKSLSSTLTVQDQALSQLADSAQGARNAIAEAIATGSATGLMTTLQGYLSQATDSLNSNYQGRYLFAGSQSGTAPVGSLTLADLTAAPSIPGLFSNDQQVATSRLDDKQTVTTGFLASNLGQPLFQALQAVEALNQGGSGPLSGTLTQAQQTALTGMLAQFDSTYDGLNTAVAQNGGAQNRVAATQTALVDRQTALGGVLMGITDVDMGEALSKLQLSQTALQASAQAFSTLKASSLLNILAPTANG